MKTVAVIKTTFTNTEILKAFEQKEKERLSKRGHKNIVTLYDKEGNLTITSEKPQK